MSAMHMTSVLKVKYMRLVASASSASSSSSSYQSQSQNQTSSQSARFPKRSLVFLGTPDVSAKLLSRLFEESRRTNLFEIKAVVTQPPRRKGRGKKVQPSPVAAIAEELGFQNVDLTDESNADADENKPVILATPSAKDGALLAFLEKMQPDICVTAAYGNFLPQQFLDIPKAGTLNVHPSLLPRFRGAAPVQRALETQENDTGVVVAYTVLKMDAGPVLASHTIDASPGAVDGATDACVGDMQAPELLEYLFERGADLLVEELKNDDVWSGEARETRATAQDDAAACAAPMIDKEESWLDPARNSAEETHAKVRAFAGWPGTKVLMSFVGDADDPSSATMDGAVEVKVLATRLLNSSEVTAPPPGVMAWQTSCKAWYLGCHGGGAVEVVTLQLPAKKPVDGKAFRNGFQNQKAVLFFGGTTES
ncbi:hypothetical protein PPROV_000993100 [Pycnococcus provasolii]|uniref:Methionyl-tRNA formyltransferase, mitochondrial n=1 Tax=Pycnococcus provasolii TaxID=41880 RepID=A0A830I0G6_9CHLO|nr:hypothetical protein PPROV_000993100 [Pycnococcus provasolii]